MFVTLQEVDNSDNSSSHFDLWHQQFVCHQSLWIQYCGLACFDPSFSTTCIPIPEDARCLLAQVTHINDFIEPFFILVIYVSANVTRERREFFEQLLQFHQLDPYDDRSCADRLIIAGDCNFTIQSSQASSSYRNWIQLLNSHFHNLMSELRDLCILTFRRSAVTRSTINYLFLSTILSANHIDATVDFADPEWSDHAIISVELKLDLADSHGPGAWRANPVYLDHRDFLDVLLTC
ncbi:hypothetical protein RMATCC62417_17461 [Rhizopus microsporus]|nr:hypothetical protein RMATCC62417_17461 [Rhizopus microsporus]